MTDIILVLHNIRSIHNVGSIFRTAEGFGVGHILLTGYTPYPRLPNDSRLPHILEKMSAQIHKTALGAEKMVSYSYQESPDLAGLRKKGYVIAGLEQDERAVMLDEYKPARKLALILGEEVSGIESDLLDQCDVLLEIPMRGRKESFNVSVATGIALYSLTIHS